MTEVRIIPGERTGKVEAPASKSETLRLLLAAALGDREVTVETGRLSDDVRSMAESLAALGAGIRILRGKTAKIRVERGLVPTDQADAQTEPAICPVRESAAVLRFLLPVAGALGKKAVFQRKGRLAARPLEPLKSELERHGMRFREEGDLLYAEGKLAPDAYALSGAVSSEFGTGLLFALPLLEGESSLAYGRPVRSRSYLGMTEEILEKSGVAFDVERRTGGLLYRFPGRARFVLPSNVKPSGDYSGSAYFLALGAFSEGGITVTGLDPQSGQGDRKILSFLRAFGANVQVRGNAVTVLKGSLSGITADVADTPDLLPVLAVLGAAAKGTTHFIHAGRLRLKETDRLQETAKFLRKMGVSVTEEADGLTIEGQEKLHGAEFSSVPDHRIIMAEALAATVADGPSLIRNAGAVRKSFPDFFEKWNELN